MLSAVQHPKEVQELNRVVQYPKPGAKWLGVHCSPKGACSICPLDLSQGVLVSHGSGGWGVVVEPYLKRVGSNTGVDRKPRGGPYCSRSSL